MLEPKPLFIERMRKLLGEQDYELYWKCCQTRPIDSIRCNTLKISVEELKNRLEKKWKVVQLFKDYPEIFRIESKLEPGELGKSIEHLLGYYYVQEISSMMPMLVLKPAPGEMFLDLCASPGSKTTQAAMMMENQGSIIANDVSIGRIMILATNLQRCSVMNNIITRADGVSLCKKLDKLKIKFDKVLVDAPCSGEGTIRSSPKSLFIFSENLIKNLSGKQKSLAAAALSVLKVGGEMIYSTCTHAPEENEEVVSYLLDNFPIELMEIKLPLKTRPGITEWNGKKYNPGVLKCARIYPHDNDTEGFFICKIKKIGEMGEVKEK